MNSPSKKWLKKIAKQNNVKPEEVLKYIYKISHGEKVIHHLKLV